MNELSHPTVVNGVDSTMTALNRSKRCFLVMGVPSSANRLMGRLLEAAGCVSDLPASHPTDHRKLWMNRKPHADLIVMRRHIATGMRPPWAQDENIITSLEMEGYDVYGIIMSRCQLIVEKSMAAAPHVENLQQARSQAMWAWHRIFKNLPEHVPFDVVQYESLVKRPRLYLDALGARWGLQFPDSVECIRDGNEKYWEALRG